MRINGVARQLEMAANNSLNWPEYKKIEAHQIFQSCGEELETSNNTNKKMNWIKITADETTHPKHGQICWVKINDNPYPYEFAARYSDWSGSFNDDSDDCVFQLVEVSHWAPATPPEFDGER